MQAELFEQETLLVGSSTHQCGQYGKIKSRDCKHYCITCGRAIKTSGSFIVADDDDGSMSRELAETRLAEIHKLKGLLSPLEQEEI